MVRFSRVCRAVVPMSYPQVLQARKRIKDEEGNTLKSCDNHEGLKTLPRNAMECEKILSFFLAKDLKFTSPTDTFSFPSTPLFVTISHSPPSVSLLDVRLGILFPTSDNRL